MGFQDCLARLTEILKRSPARREQTTNYAVRLFVLRFCFWNRIRYGLGEVERGCGDSKNHELVYGQEFHEKPYTCGKHQSYEHEL